MKSLSLNDILLLKDKLEPLKAFCNNVNIEPRTYYDSHEKLGAILTLKLLSELDALPAQDVSHYIFDGNSCENSYSLSYHLDLLIEGIYQNCGWNMETFYPNEILDEFYLDFLGSADIEHISTMYYDEQLIHDVWEKEAYHFVDNYIMGNSMSFFKTVWENIFFGYSTSQNSINKFTVYKNKHVGEFLNFYNKKNPTELEQCIYELIENVSAPVLTRELEFYKSGLDNTNQTFVFNDICMNQTSIILEIRNTHNFFSAVNVILLDCALKLYKKERSW